MTRVVFLGTPGAALPTLEAVHARTDLALVVTRPDRPRGRSGRPSPPPAADWARRKGVRLAQPESRAELLDALESESFDLGVVVAYGRILPAEALQAPAMGMLNVHFSLLPRWRGAAPVARAILAGDTITGVTIIRLDEGLDTGPVLTAQAVDIVGDETAGALTERLSRLGANLLVSSIGPYLRGELVPVAQSDEGATYADKLTADDRRLDLGDGVELFVNRVRALSPRPGARLDIDGETFKVLAAKPVEDDPPPRGSWRSSPGGSLLIGIDGTAVALTRVQPPGRAEMGGEDWVRGSRRPGGRVG
jgi:methionyl-tRNA formyltransferase